MNSNDSNPPESPSEFLKIGPHVLALPVVHGSADFAVEVRRMMMQHEFDCVAVPLPPSFQHTVEKGVVELPSPSIVIQRNNVAESWKQSEHSEWKPGSDNDDDEGGAGSSESSSVDSNSSAIDPNAASYVPIDPCQPVIAALRTAMGEHLPIQFIDLETADYRPNTRVLPDAYALKKVSVEKFAAAVLPSLQAPQNMQWRRRIAHMAWRLRELSVDFKKILFVVSVMDWPWVRAAFNDTTFKLPEDDDVNEVEIYQVKMDTLYFMLGELPYITELYEDARADLEDDANMSIDGVKELLIAAREQYVEEYKSRARKITPKLLAQCIKYVRNLTLIDHCFSPQLATIVTAAQQTIGDGYALHVLEKAKEYGRWSWLNLPELRMGVDNAAITSRDSQTEDEVIGMVSRLPGPPVQWTHLKLVPRPDRDRQREWQTAWNPMSQCSWPPEDELIENFRQAVFDRAREITGEDLAKTEKFTTSVKDGIDIRDTVRHWYEGDIYVKVLPPNRGKMDCAVMLFDSPADPRDYSWRTTWFAEHKDESTLCFYATDYAEEPVGPGICLSTYGGAMFLYPPIAIPDIWRDPRLDFTNTLEERLLAAACLHSQCPQIALVSAAPPGPAWRQLAKSYGKKWVHLPLGRFSDSTIQQLRMVHVLNGKQVRSYAADFIRRS